MFFVLEAMGLFEFVPFVVIDGLVAIQIKGLEDFWFCMRKIGLEFFQGDEFIAIFVHVGEVGIEGFWVRQ